MIVMKEQGAMQVIDWFDKMKVDFPNASDRNAWNVAEMVAKELQKSKRNAGIQDFTGKLSSSLAKPRKIRKNIYTIPMPLYAYMLDSMKIHRVGPDSLPSGIGSGGGEKIAEYMLSKWGGIFPWMWVRPKPFIGAAMLSVAQRLRPELENGVMLKSLQKGGSKR